MMENIQTALAIPPPILLINNESVNACPCHEGVDRWAYVEMKAERNFYKVIHAESQAREAALKKAFKLKEDELRLLNQKFYGKRSEQGKKQRETASDKPASTRPKGQQAGSKGHGRLKHPKLERQDESQTLPSEDQSCATCHLPFTELASTADSEILEIEVKAHVRKIKRHKYKRHAQCQCPGTSIITTAPVMPKLLPKMNIGISLWVDVIIRKYDEQCPLNRVLMSLEKHGVKLSAGTVTGGLQKLEPLFKPIATAFEQHCQADRHWHADETRWEVFEKIEGKVSTRWWLWVFRGDEAITYRIAPTRGYEVADEFFKDIEDGILNCDRYAVYIKLAKNTAILLALCWAHVRRDFLDLTKSNAAHEAWAFSWIEAIGALYHLNKQRVSKQKETPLFREAQVRLSEQVSVMEKTFEAELIAAEIEPPCLKILTSLKKHWPALTLFVDHPEIPMDNNKGEQSIRPPTLGRKNYYGSGSVWSARLTAFFFSLFATLHLWKLNTRTWLTHYLRACEQNGGEPPADLSPFLPWKMSDAQREIFSEPIDDG